MVSKRFCGAIVGSLLATAVAIGHLSPAIAQTAESRPWFGVTPAPGFQPHVAPVILGTDYGPRPVTVPPGEEGSASLEGEAIYSDLETIVDFSKRSRETQEVGSGQLWGRITGLPSGEHTLDWIESRFRQAGVPRVERQWFEQTPGASLWLPLSWEIRIRADPAFGMGSRDVILESAMPAGGTELPPEGLTAPLVFVGTARPAELEYIDVRGKIAVQHITPKGHLFLERGPARAKAQELVRRGALAVFNIVDQAGNMRMRDISNCNGPCFNIGGQDGRFLEEVMDAAADAGVSDRLLATLQLEAEDRSGMRASNVLGIVPGESDENIIINAHADGWFDGANDNGDGLAVTIALAEHFSKPENRQARTLVFVASAGHHTSGLNGPDKLVEMNPELIARNILTLNLEHVAARQLNPARTATDGVRDIIADAGEGFLMNGMNQRSPYLEAIIREGGLRYGLNFVSAASTYHAGDNPDVERLFQLIQGNPLYHTSGETIETISTPGLERVARFVAFFVKEVAVAPRSEL
ncbi:MAG: M28 family peptidase [Pseudohongiellaceae bacterium]